MKQISFVFKGLIQIVWKYSVPASQERLLILIMHTSRVMLFGYVTAIYHVDDQMKNKHTQRASCSLLEMLNMVVCIVTTDRQLVNTF
jgi:hypothetical protein